MCSNNDFDPRFVGVIIHNLSQEGTVQKELIASDGGANWHSADTSGHVNPTGLF